MKLSHLIVTEEWRKEKQHTYLQLILVQCVDPCFQNVIRQSSRFDRFA